MSIIPDNILVVPVIQQAIAPVFLVTGIGAILNVLINRLERVTERLRALSKLEGAERDRFKSEYLKLQRRAKVSHWAITLCTTGALLICIIVAILFIGAEIKWDPSSLIAPFFIMAMMALISGLLCFLREVTLAMETMREKEKEKI
jgi:Ni/Fe-hydrogenase subunit HybB-like protein